MMRRLSLILVVTGAWLLAGIVLGAQSSLGSAMTGANPVRLGAALRTALVQTLPWVPVSLAVIALTLRFPLGRERWKRNVLVHVSAAIALAFAAQVLVVLGFWVMQGRFDGPMALVRAGATWTTLRIHLALLIYGAILAITEGAMYYRASRERELRLARVEGQLVRAHLQALTAQIRPHFLFNTLHTIGQMWRSGRSAEADAVLDHLGALFHKVQQSTSRVEVPLAEELELAREYLAIEEARFRDRLRATIAAPDAALGCLVPPLILQPLVENAVRHGIAATSTARSVAVTASMHDGTLALSIRDDGPGMGSSSASAGSGTGLRNTRERLAQLYGDRASLETLSPPEGGTLVRIQIPQSNGGAHP